MTLVIHPDSQRLLSALAAGDTHALLLTGPHGIGLATIAKELTGQKRAEYITVLPEKDEKVNIEKGTITVQSIRRLYDMTRTRQPAGRTIIIDYAERMAPPAQNAFLKLLEEPAQGTRFILLTHQPELLLPTITSRSQRVDIRPATKQQSETLLDALGVHDATKRAQLLFIANGLPAELTRLANDDEYFATRVTLVKDARSFVSGSPYGRLLIAKKYKDSRTDALMLLEDAMKLLKMTLSSNGDAATLRMLSRFEVLHKRITEQGNVRLQLSAAIMV